MSPSITPQQTETLNQPVTRFAHHQNAFGFLRLIFASLVIAAHVPEIIDGNRQREIFTMIFGTLSSGEIAVSGFFIISGFLITGSFVKNGDRVAYGIRRIARIYPGFIVASLVCVLLVAPLSGADMHVQGIKPYIKGLVWLLLLQPPYLPHTFVGMHYPALNGPMWTIAYEFRCYLLVMVLSALGMLNRPRACIALAAACLFASAFIPRDLIFNLYRSEYVGAVFGDLKSGLKLAAYFLAGASFFLMRDHLNMNGKNIFIALLGLLVGLCFKATADFAVATCGAFLIFACAQRAAGTFVANINNEDDISYGVYLYAWPITMLLIWRWPDIHPLEAGLLTLALALLLGWLSWRLVEKPAMMLSRHYLRSRARRKSLVAP
jgi:peptidoglycan/LPS O-acetylase OafA/YrhL